MKNYEIEITELTSFASLVCPETGDAASYVKTTNTLKWIPKGSQDLEYDLPCRDLFSALDIFNQLLNDVYGSGFSHGGKRPGAGRKKKEPTKAVRLNGQEEKFLKFIRDKGILQDLILEYGL
tara:strand:+ start:4387 stop:4752 length:366 start_codon:yes stop_codon:yes gene_type:complete